MSEETANSANSAENTAANLRTPAEIMFEAKNYWADRARKAEAERDALKIAMNLACAAIQGLAPLGSDPSRQDMAYDCLEILQLVTAGIRQGDFSKSQFQPIALQLQLSADFSENSNAINGGAR